jgi:hypothetical protein
MNPHERVYYAHKDCGIYWHASISESFVRLHLLDLPIVKVRLRERTAAEPLLPGERDYHGWVYSNDPSRYVYMWPSRAQVSVCFAQGAEEAARQGEGRLVPLVLTELVEVSDWIPYQGYCAMRIVAGQDPAQLGARVAFIEKTPRVRVVPYTDLVSDHHNWRSGPRGSSEAADGGPGYGQLPASRAWCDAELARLGYDVPNPVLA